MKEKLKGILDIKTLQFGKVRELIEAASDNAAAVIAKAIEKYELADDTIVFRKSVKDSTQRIKKDERVVVAKISTGGLDLSGEVMLQSGVIRDYHNGVCLYVHDYGAKYLPIGRCVHMDVKDGALVAATVFAKHTLADELYHLYADDVTYEGVNMGPICRDWSVDYIPLKSVRPSGRGWKSALGKAINERPDLKERQDDIQSIVTSWLLLGYSAAPIGMNPEAKTVLEGKSFKSNELKLDIEHLEEPEKEEVPVEGKILSTTPPEEPEPEEVVSPEEEIIIEDNETEEPPEKIDEPGQSVDDEIPAGGDADKPVVEEVEKPKEEKEVEDEAGEVAPEPTPAPEFSQKMIEGRAKALSVEGKGMAEAMEYMSFTIPIFAPIEPNTALWIVDFLIAVNLYDPDQEVTILLNSPGGYTADSFAITDTMEYVQSKGTKIKTVGLGEVASSGLMIFMTGDERIIAPNAQILSHRFWSGAMGSQPELQAQVVEWKNVHKRILDHYAKHSKYSDVESIEANLLKETDTWLTSKQAIKHGLADKVLSEKYEFAEVQPIEAEEEEKSEPIAEGKALADINLDIQVNIEDAQDKIVPYSPTEKEDEDRPWNGDLARKNLAKWASSDGTGNKDTINWAKYRKGFTWYDEDKPENFGSYELLHHDVKDNILMVSWSGTRAAMSESLDGSVDMPDNERRAAYNHLAKHYAQFDKDVPEYHTENDEAPEYATLDELAEVRTDLEYLQQELYDNIDATNELLYQKGLADRPEEKKEITITNTKQPEPEITSEDVAKVIAEQLSAIDIPALFSKHLKRALGKVK